MERPKLEDYAETIYRADAWKYTIALQKYVRHLETKLEQLELTAVVQAKPEKFCDSCGVRFKEVWNYEYDTCPKCG